MSPTQCLGLAVSQDMATCRLEVWDNMKLIDFKLNIFLPYFKQVLMLIDASFGFEMETFEFLNICQVHGFPKIMGVLTHLDSFKNNKQLRKIKKRLKHRFWTEVYQVSYKIY